MQMQIGTYRPTYDRDLKTGRYTFKSRVSRFFAKVWMWTKYTMFGLATASVIFFMGYAYHGDQVSAEVNYIAVPPMSTTSPATIQDKIELLKNNVLDEMNACENPHHLLTWNDDNSEHTLPMKDKPSNGDMAYKISTVKREYKILYGKDLTDKDALELALEQDQARALAINAWVNIKGSINEWSCANDKMKTQVEDIRLLTK